MATMEMMETVMAVMEEVEVLILLVPLLVTLLVVHLAVVVVVQVVTTLGVEVPVAARRGAVIQSLRRARALRAPTAEALLLRIRRKDRAGILPLLRILQWPGTRATTTTRTRASPT